MPETFTFPARTSTKSAYKLLGNSLNVKVVTHLLNFMFREPA
jgi:tRNA (cytosine38-C5)-methyltransferase